MTAMQLIFNKIYDGESIIDLSRDVDECMNECHNSIMHNIPQDEYGLHRGSFRVTIEWYNDE